MDFDTYYQKRTLEVIHTLTNLSLFALTIYQLGPAACIVREFTRLDTIPRCLATGDYSLSSRYQLDFRT